MKIFFSVKLPILLPSLAMLIFAACQPENGSGKSVEEIQTEGKISSIIRSPVSASGTTDTVNVAKMTFDETTYDFGEAAEGEIVKYVFKFTNTGKVPLVINNASSTCGCTIPVWPKEAIPPGQSGEIKVEFNTTAKHDFQEKPVIISANTYPSNTTVYLKGYVNPKRED